MWARDWAHVPPVAHGGFEGCRTAKGATLWLWQRIRIYVWGQDDRLIPLQILIDNYSMNQRKLTSRSREKIYHSASKADSEISLKVLKVVCLHFPAILFSFNWLLFFIADPLPHIAHIARLQEILQPSCLRASLIHGTMQCAEKSCSSENKRLSSTSSARFPPWK